MPAKSKANPSLFSGVFKLVSREFENFVTNALPESNVFSEEEDEEFDDQEHGLAHEGSLERHDARSPPKKRTKTGSHRRSPTPEEQYSQHDSSTLPKQSRLGHLEEIVIPDGREGRSPSPTPLPRALKRRPSISMPGSLFPRSPSLEPEHLSTIEREQRVRFASTILDSPHPHFAPHISKPQSAVSSPPPSTPRHRKQFDPTVQAAVGRFQEDADPSILLPKMQTSPHSVHQYSGVDKGKGTVIEVTPIEDCETSGILRVRGKEKELVAVREDLNKNERRLERTDETESSFFEQVKQDRDRDKEKIRMLEGEIERLKKELMRQSASAHPLPPPPPPPPPARSVIALPDALSNPTLFASARASLRHAPTPVENPINPLPTSRRVGMPTVGIPPEKMVAFLNEMKTVRLRKVSASEKRSTSLGSDTSFASAPNTSTCEGANSSSSSLFRRSFSSLNRVTDVSWGSRHSTATGNHSMSEIESRRGEKRKRTITGSHEEPRPLRPIRHRSAASSAESSFATGSNTSFISDALAGPSLSQSYPPPLVPANSTGTSWPSSSVTDAPTPSLCSDNDIERDENSLDDQSPSTPPVTTGPSRAFFRFKGNGIPVDPERLQRKNGDVTMADEESTHTDPKLKPNAKPTIFDKRPPTSPFPNKSPRRPRPPTRKMMQTNQHTLPSHSTPCSPPLSDDEEDPLSLTFSSPERALQASGLRRTQTRQKNDVNSRASPPATRVPSSRIASKAPAPSQQSRPPRHRSASESSRSGRRLTLDEELRNAFAAAASSSRVDETLVQDDEETGLQEDSVLVGVGTRSKHRGFLPGGGASGAPVFRGVGYVEGAVEHDEALEEEPRHSRRSGSRRQRGDDDDDEYLPPSKRSVHR